MPGLWLPRFEYDTGPTVWEPADPVAWEPGDTTELGSSITAASGIPAAFYVRRDYRRRFTLRIRESEHVAAEEMIEFLKLHPNTGTIYPNRSDLEVFRIFYLESPLMGEAFDPPRAGRFPRVMEVPIVLRCATPGQRWSDIPFYG